MVKKYSDNLSSSQAFKAEEEAINRANDTTYGLGSAVFTENLTRAHRAARRIEARMVWVNSSNDSDSWIPFRGGQAEWNWKRVG